MGSGAFDLVEAFDRVRLPRQGWLESCEIGNLGFESTKFARDSYTRDFVGARIFCPCLGTFDLRKFSREVIH